MVNSMTFLDSLREFFSSPAVFGTLALFVLVLLLFSSAVSLKKQGLDAHPYALGLPRHSVRAIVALAFTLLFGSLGFLAIDTASGQEFIVGGPVAAKGTGETKTDSHVDALDKLRVKLDSLRDTLSAPDLQEKITIGGTSNGSSGSYSVVATGVLISVRESAEATQMSREVLVIIATALSTIVGFYFGARSHASTNASGDDSGDPAKTAERLRVQGELRAEIARLENIIGTTTNTKTKKNAKDLVAEGTTLLMQKVGEFAEIELAMSAKKTEARIKALSALLTKMKAVV